MLLRPLSDTFPSGSSKQSPGELDIGSIPLRKLGVPGGLSYGKQSSVLDEEKRCFPEDSKNDDEDLSFYLDNIPKTFSGSIPDLLRRYSSSSELSSVSEPQRPYIKLPGSEDGGEGYRARYYDMIRIPPPPLVEFGTRFPPDEPSDEDERDSVDPSGLSRRLASLYDYFGWQGRDRGGSIDSQDPFIPPGLLDREVEEEQRGRIDFIDLSSVSKRISTLSDGPSEEEERDSIDSARNLASSFGWQRINRGNSIDSLDPFIPPGLLDREVEEEERNGLDLSSMSKGLSTLSDEPNAEGKEEERDSTDSSDLSRSLESLFGGFGWRGSDRVDSFDSQDPFIPPELLDREVEEEEERDSVDLSSVCERMSTLSDFFASFKKNKKGDKSSKGGNRGDSNDSQPPRSPPGLCREGSSSSSSRDSPRSSLLSEPEPKFNPKLALDNERYTKKQLSLFGDFLRAPFSLSNATTPSPVMNDLGPLDTEAHVDCYCNRCRLLDYALTRDFDEIHPFALVNLKYAKGLDDEGNYIY
ncbi:uncharacterized protein FOMMEDRAFT_26079 [Fomitiporia mediterranea MF3/22]|uniref:uncharacterized protein n=1 Tax=Fomitiporia mediterranea (strain MF3/22) TaxID=694068 RepID=UPI000440969D|nr:uncharacterized protein FOMMEDRAFT_26079 [Fomitiporia mediterranea MF3/22]EJD06927.1 hypothetical protein FOMMEDRAFT_26079 [Fomitiporia mediterranea MF3/22]